MVTGGRCADERCDAKPDCQQYLAGRHRMSETAGLAMSAMSGIVTSGSRETTSARRRNPGRAEMRRHLDQVESIATCVCREVDVLRHAERYQKLASGSLRSCDVEVTTDDDWTLRLNDQRLQNR